MVMAELADAPLLEDYSLHCSISYDFCHFSDQYDWSTSAPSASEQFKIRKSAALQKAGFDDPAQKASMVRWESSRSCGRSLHSMEDFSINDLVSISRVRVSAPDEPSFMGVRASLLAIASFGGAFLLAMKTQFSKQPRTQSKCWRKPEADSIFRAVQV